MKNPKVFYLSLLALVFVALTFLVDWIFIAGAVIIMIYNQKLLRRKS